MRWMSGRSGEVDVRKEMVWRIGRWMSGKSVEVDLKERDGVEDWKKDNGSWRGSGRKAGDSVPSPPFNCTVSNQTWESVEVTCGDPRAALGHHHHHHASGHHSYDMGHHGYETGHYESGQQGDVYETNEVVLVATPGYPAELLQDSDKPRYLVTVQERVSCAVTHNVTGERGKFSVTGLTPGLDYVISVARYNSHGRSSNVTLEAFTLRTAENRMREEFEGSGSALLGVVLGVLGVVLLLALAAIVVTLRYRGRSSSSSSSSSSTLRHGSPSVKTQLPPGGEGSESGGGGGGLDHPDLLEAEAHVPSSVVAPYRSPGAAAEVTQALLPPPATRNLQQEEEVVGATPSSVSPTTVHLDYLSACESGPDPITAPSSSVRAHPHLYVRAESHLAGQQESFL
ncbi:hypothetical protein Pmani_004812 [Petrolisthes manimaculis]|uniref:Fibronectin type-III domain-containing protein n=1 Tax=Petrolisthes manimaculis TaxID=1843537 RepID=A0AAE1QDI0_9EUCA|nr:hypothetical protein Pmani_004812 [Petrolisthes manimaculis]